MSKFTVFVHYKLWVNVPVAIFLGTVDYLHNVEVSRLDSCKRSPLEVFAFCVVAYERFDLAKLQGKKPVQMSVVIIIKFNLLLLAAWPLHQLLFAPDPAHHALAGNALFLFLLKTCHVTLHQAAVLETNHPVAKQDISSE